MEPKRTIEGLLPIGTLVRIKDHYDYEWMKGKKTVITDHVTYCENRKGYRVEGMKHGIYIESDFAVIGEAANIER